MTNCAPLSRRQFPANDSCVAGLCPISARLRAEFLCVPAIRHPAEIGEPLTETSNFPEEDFGPRRRVGLRRVVWLRYSSAQFRGR
jgi:hypothetical protein